MKQFIDKLIERLEERRQDANNWSDSEDDYFGGKEYAYENAIEIVNQLAEEYTDKDCSECSRRKWYQIGYADAEKKLADECNNDFCEWKFTKSVADGGYFYSSGCNHKRFSDLHSFEFCPYCGKKIKVAPYQPKGE